MKMKSIKRSIDINCDNEFIFELTQNYSLRLEWDKYLSKAYLLNGATEPSVGVYAYCKNNNGSSMISEYISYQPSKVAAISMKQGPIILKKFSGSWTVKKLGGTLSTLTFTYHFSLKGGFLGKLVQPIANYYFSKDMSKRLMAFKYYAEKNIKTIQQT